MPSGIEDFDLGPASGVAEVVFGDAPEGVAGLDSDGVTGANRSRRFGEVGVGWEYEGPARAEGTVGLEGVAVGLGPSGVEGFDLGPAVGVAEGAFGDGPEGVEVSDGVSGRVDLGRRRVRAARRPR
ncbi:MAG: hypothetical protein ACRDY6_06675 [Acidimicrobiia bacterium]